VVAVSVLVRSDEPEVADCDVRGCFGLPEWVVALPERPEQLVDEAPTLRAAVCGAHLASLLKRYCCAVRNLPPAKSNLKRPISEGRGPNGDSGVFEG
jgi:hypothetical protein